MAPGLAVEGRDAHQAVHAALGLQPAIGVLALDAHGGRLDAGLLARALLQPFELVAAGVGPAHIHAQQHLRPVLRLRATRPGIDFQIAVIAVGLAGKQALQPPALRPVPKRLEIRLGLVHRRLVLFRLAELVKRDCVVERAFQRPVALQPVGQPRPFAHHLLGARRVVPQFRGFGLGVQRLQPRRGRIPVKDASGSGQDCRGCHPPGPALLHASNALHRNRDRLSIYRKALPRFPPTGGRGLRGAVRFRA